MSDLVISVENISKLYLVGHDLTQGRAYSSFREVLSQQLRTIARKAVDLGHGRPIVQGDALERFWALKDLSFEINRGEVIGIIGRNGAGKSTLLKILSRITEPTEGRVKIVGRVASLLEVGTGFHPELTGRENVFLNGSILGMTRTEITRKFDDIVGFAEVEKFIDTPVKRYSSGMYVRLAFAVAAHLDPEILIVDEVLAVGDADFQKKCLGKIQDVAGHGRTVLMVSHNTHAVRSLCKSTITLQEGRLLYFGDTDVAIQLYNGSSIESSNSRINLNDKPRALFRDAPVRLLSLSLNDGQPAVLGEPFTIFIELEASDRVPGTVVGVGFCSQAGTRILTADSNYAAAASFDLSPGRHIVKCAFRSLPLAPATYLLDVGCRSDSFQIYDEVKEACGVEVFPQKDAPPWHFRKYATYLHKADWDLSNA